MVHRSIVGKWVRADGAIHATFTKWGGYLLYVANISGPKGGQGRVPPLSPTTRGTYKIVDASHIQFNNHGKSLTNGIIVAGNQMTLTNPDGTALVWTRTG